MTLVAEVRSAATDTYAVVARNGSHLFVAFRGSCSTRNVISDLSYDDDAATTAAFAAECNLPTPPGQELLLHRGFVEAYRGLRPALHAVLAAELEAELATEVASEVATEIATEVAEGGGEGVGQGGGEGVGQGGGEGVGQGGGGLGLVLTGHSMGGAMAMLAALDFAHTQPKLRPVST